MIKIIFSLSITLLLSLFSFAMQPVAPPSYLGVEVFDENSMQFEFRGGKIYLHLKNEKFNVAKIKIDEVNGSFLVGGIYEFKFIENFSNLYLFIKCIIKANPDEQKKKYRRNLKKFFCPIIQRSLYSEEFPEGTLEHVKLSQQIANSRLLQNCIKAKWGKLKKYSNGDWLVSEDSIPLDHMMLHLRSINTKPVYVDGRVLAALSKNIFNPKHLTVHRTMDDEQLGAALKKNTSIVHLKLVHTGGVGKLPATFGRYINNHKTLRTLDLSGISIEIKLFLSQLLTNNKTLTKLILDDVGMYDGDMDHLADMISGNSVLKELSLQNNIISGSGTGKLAQILKDNTTIVSLKLSLNLNAYFDKGLYEVEDLWIEALRNNKTLREFPEFAPGHDMLEDLIEEKKIMLRIPSIMIVLERVPNDIKKIILTLIINSVMPPKTKELELLLAAAEKNKKAIGELVDIYKNIPKLHVKYAGLLLGKGSEQYPLIVYPELAYCYYKNRGYKLTLWYLRLIDESGNNAFKPEIERLSQGLPLRADCELLKMNRM